MLEAFVQNVVISAQVLPGLIIGVLCWIAALVFIVWVRPSLELRDWHFCKDLIGKTVLLCSMTLAAELL